MSINELSRKIKGIGTALDSRDHFAMILIFLTGLFCFFCGILYERERIRTDVVITENLGYQPLDVIKTDGLVSKQFQTATSSPAKGMYVASKSSRKFHLPWCSGAQRISEANEIWFSSKEEALTAGYSPAANCPGI